MPQIIRSIDQIMAREKRDMLFIRFGNRLTDNAPSDEWRRKHLEWFDFKGLRYEKAAPRGWLEGDPGIYVVYFDGVEDPRLAEYSASFEEADGQSLSPDGYQMVIIDYEGWLEDRRKQEPEED